MLSRVLEWLSEHGVTTQVISTLLLIILTLGARFLVVVHIRRTTRHSDNLRRRWLIQIRNATLLFIGLGLIVIWASELRTLALSAIAIAAAIVIATKELLMCVAGTLVEGSARSFSLGDRIEVDGIRGDVFDQTLLTTTVLEVGPGAHVHQYTGRTVTIPNSLFLSKPIVNESFTDDYLVHVFTVPMSTEDDWRAMERRLLDVANHVCAPYFEEARRHLEAVGEEQGMRALSVEPRVTLRLTEPKRIDLLVRIPAPARGRGRIEQEILRRALGETPPPPAPTQSP